MGMPRLVGVKANVARGLSGTLSTARAGRPKLKSLCRCKVVNVSNGQVAQSVEQRTENPCVGGSIPPLATKVSSAYPKFPKARSMRAFLHIPLRLFIYLCDI